MAEFEVGDRVQSTLTGLTGVVVNVLTADWFNVKVDKTGDIVLFDQCLFELQDEPTPKLDKLMQSPSLFAETEEDRLIKNVDKLIHNFHTKGVDPEEAHGAEDEMYKKALRLIAVGKSRDPAKLSAKLLELEALDFPRWYA